MQSQFVNHQFYQVNIFNPDLATSPIYAEFQEVRQQPIIQNPSEYQVAVSRVEIPTSFLPLFFFQDGQYKVTLTYVATGQNYQQIVVNTQPLSTSDKAIYSVQGFLDDINTAFELAYTALVTDHPGTVDFYPVMIFNPATQLFSLLVDPKYATGYPYPNTTDNVQIWMNRQLYVKFGSFNVEYTNVYNAPSGKDYKFVVNDTGNNQYTYTFLNTATPTKFLRIEQDAPSHSMSDVSSIIITSNSLPLITDQFARSYGGNQSFALSTQGKSANLPILTEFFVEPSTFQTPASTAVFLYNAALYRMYDLFGNNPIQTLDFKFYWSDRQGNLYPLQIAPGRSLNLKIVFIKKGLFN